MNLDDWSRAKEYVIIRQKFNKTQNNKKLIREDPEVTKCIII